MVKKSARLPRSGRRRHGTLTKKLFRDMKHSAMQFFAMMMLCFLGTWVFSGLDANWRMLDLSFETYFSENNVADLWLKGSGFSAEDLAVIEHMDAMAEIIPRTNLTADCPDLGSDVTVSMLAYDGEMTINMPYLRSGSLLDPGDKRGILVEQQFADAQGLQPGDRIKLRLQGMDMTFFVRGIVLSPEYIVTAKETSPVPQEYGFVLINRNAVQMLPINELICKLRPGYHEQEVIDEITSLLPGVLVLTVGTNGGTATARSFVGMFKSMCYLFPVIVYIVATMIVVSTLTRMIENQRIQMGTLKALGFSNRKIRNHYMTYALVPSFIGSLTGLVAAQYTLPDIIWLMLAHNARMPYKLRPQISILSWISFVGTILLSLIVCYLVYRKAARESTADLLRPKPPKSGSRILLERWNAVWHRLSFNTKMVIRNIFRNKGRSFLSLVGVFCCNMLIVCSFSLQDSIPAFITNYHTGTHAYTIRADLTPGQCGSLESYQKRLDAGIVEGLMEKSVSAIGPDSIRSCLLTVIPQGQQLIHLGEDQTLLPLTDEGASVSRKLCRLLGVSVGDTLEVYLTGDPEPIMLDIVQYAETSIGQGIFISQNAWDRLRKGSFIPTSLLFSEPSAKLLHELQEMDDVSSLKYPQVQNKQTLSIMDSTTTMFGILSGAALLLAFIICYNMGLMNYTERTRDYATLKVLGYHQKEIRKLMMREQQAISLIATAVSVYPGMLLTTVILKLCEYDSMVFSSTFKPLSLAKACLISIVFAWAIEALLTTKVKKIDMVEALKSVE